MSFQVPRKWRVPNGPAAFVGRPQEVAWLDRAVQRGPIALVAGGGGLGKTALVLHALHGHHSGLLPRTLYISVPPETPGLQVRRTILTALCESTGQDVAESNDPEELTHLALDIAEAHGLCVVVDDLHHTERDEASELLVQLASFARESRWLITTRLHPKLDRLAGQVLALGPMSDVDMQRLIDAWSTDADAGARSFDTSAGSPWLLLQSIHSGPTATVDAGADLIATLHKTDADLLIALSVLRRALPVEDVGSFAPVPDAAGLEALERRGLIVLQGGTIRLHDVVVPLLSALAQGGDWVDPAVQALAIASSVDAVLEALRLHIELGQSDACAALLSKRGDEVLSAGFAPRLFRLLQKAQPKTLRHWRLRCAAEMGNPTALSAVEAPTSPSANDRLQWAHALYARGDVAKARDEAAVVREEAASADIAQEATLLEARARSFLGDNGGAAAVLASSATNEGECLRFLVAAREGRQVGAPPLASDAPTRSIVDVAEACWALGRRDEALAALERVPGDRFALRTGRRAALLQARLLLEGGACEAAERLVSVVRPYSRGASILRPTLFELDAIRALWWGPVRDAVGPLSAMAREAAAGPATMARSAELDVELREAQGVGPERSPQSAAEHYWAWRSGEDTPAMDPTCFWGLREASLRALVAGDRSLAFEHNISARNVARRAGERRLEFYAYCDEADIRIVMGDVPDAAVASLRAMADEIGSPRLNALSLFYENIESPAHLEALAGAQMSESASRRSRAILGRDEWLDRVDTLVVERAKRWNVRTIGETSEWQPGWGLDMARAEVWRADGTRVSLASRKLLWRILVCLAETGEADKETLVERVWEVGEYHPLKHDTRLQVSVRKLRAAIEDKPSAPRLVVTTEVGYTLGTPLRIAESKE